MRFARLALVALAACGGGLEATAWPQADRLFRADPRWLGGDDAFSVDLGGGRVLWLFADSFVATSDAHVRAESVMVHNSVAIQTGADPRTAEMSFYWRGDGGAPASFFPEEGGTWFWPGHGIRIGDSLLLFLMQVRAAPGGLGFAVVGWDAVLIDDPDQPPDRWTLTPVEAPQRGRIIVGSASVLAHRGYLFAYGADEASPDHDIYLVCWPLALAAAGDLTLPAWWSGPDKGFLADLGFTLADPQPVFSGGQTELTVHADGGGFLAVQTVGFGAASIAARRADRPEGPWSDAEPFYDPPDGHRDGGLVYAGKAHPELDAGGDLAVTYVVNDTDFADLVADDTIYYPRFVRVSR